MNGVVAKLIDVKDPKYATALEITAGGKASPVQMYSELVIMAELEIRIRNWLAIQQK